jgi:hypothetical protein
MRQGIFPLLSVLGSARSQNDNVMLALALLTSVQRVSLTRRIASGARRKADTSHPARSSVALRLRQAFRVANTRSGVNGM